METTNLHILNLRKGADNMEVEKKSRLITDQKELEQLYNFLLKWADTCYVVDCMYTVSNDNGKLLLVNQDKISGIENLKNEINEYISDELRAELEEELEEYYAMEDSEYMELDQIKEIEVIRYGDSDELKYELVNTDGEWYQFTAHHKELCPFQVE